MEESQVVATNKKAYHDYFIEETWEAGIALRGTEVKSLREGRVTLRDGYARVENEEVFLYCHISPYSHGNLLNHDPDRRRKLLFHREEIHRLMGRTQAKGYTLVPLKIYFKRGKAKVEIGLGRGKHAPDKRETLKRKEAMREIDRAIKAQQR